MNRFIIQFMAFLQEFSFCKFISIHSGLFSDYHREKKGFAVAFLILFSAPFAPRPGLHAQSSSEYLPYKRPELPKQPPQVMIEGKEEEDKIINTFSNNVRKKKVKKRETPPEIVEKNNFSDMEPERKAYIIKQAIANLRVIEGKKNAVESLIKILLTHPIPDVREEAARALGRKKKGGEALKKAIQQDSFSVRRQAFIALEKVGGPGILPYFTAGIKSSDPDIRFASFKGLGKTNDPYARELLINKGINSDDTKIVAAALSGLGNFSRPEDLPIFKKYLPSEIVDLQIGAIQGLGNSKANGTLELLSLAITENPNLMPEIIFSISQKNNLHSTLLLFKILMTTENENYRLMIQKEFVRRGAYGRYAIVKNPTASIKKEPRTNADKIAVLMEGDVALVKNTTEKLFKVKMNNEVYEDRYFLLNSINNKDVYVKPIIEGWVFGPKLKFISIRKPEKSKGKKGLEELLNLNEETEDENSLPPKTTIEKKGENPKKEPNSNPKASETQEFDDE